VPGEHEPGRASLIKDRHTVAVGVGEGFVGELPGIIEPDPLAAGFVADRTGRIDQLFEEGERLFAHREYLICHHQDLKGKRTTASALLDEAKKLGRLRAMNDEGDFWESCNLARLTGEIGEQSAMLQATVEVALPNMEPAGQSHPAPQEALPHHHTDDSPDERSGHEI
jgi:hypothetical protein